jgi:hypothetical protein
MKLTIQIVDDAGNVFAGHAILERVSSDEKPQAHKKPQAEARTTGKVTCSSAVERLWKKEKFKQALSFQQVKAAFEEVGCDFPTNTIIMALQRAAFLTRHGGRGSYTWRQKYPFNN